MDRVDLMTLRHVEDCRDVEVGFDRSPAVRRADEKRLVCLVAMKRKAVLVAIDGHGPQPELGGGAKAPDGDLGSVRNEQLLHACRVAITSSAGPGNPSVLRIAPSAPI